MQRIADTDALKRIGAKTIKRPLRACGHHEYDSDDYWLCFIYQGSMTVYHTSSTCPMGRADDDKAVVDPQLR